jgi:four helix bundle protein
MESGRYNVIVNETFHFSRMILDYAERLENSRRFVLSNQIIRAGTSIGANVREAQNAESKIDFIHKLKIAAKEADESEYWLLLCKGRKGYPDPSCLLTKLESIRKILSKIITTSKRSLNKQI